MLFRDDEVNLTFKNFNLSKLLIFEINEEKYCLVSNKYDKTKASFQLNSRITRSTKVNSSKPPGRFPFFFSGR